MATILPPPTQGINPLGFLVPAFQGLLQGQELGRERQDLQHLGNIQQLANLSGQAPDFSGFQSQRFRGQAGQNIFQNLGIANQPISPFQQAQLQNQQLGLRADLTRAQSGIPTSLDIEQQQADIASTRALTAERQREPVKSETQFAAFLGDKIRQGTASERDIALFDRMTGAQTPLERDQAIATLEETRKRTELLGQPPAVSVTDKELLNATIKEKTARTKQIETEIATLPATATQAKATALRKEFDGLTKEYRTQQQSYGRLLASAEDPSAAGDLALIFNYMKMLDPSSVVRESEFANAAATGSLGNRWVGVGKKLLTGERLADPVRADFVSRAKRLFESQVDIFNKTGDRFTKLSEKAGVSPEDVVTTPFPFEKQITLDDPTGAIQPPLVGGNVIVPEAGNAIGLARRRLPSTATEEEILELAEKIIRDARAKRR